MSVADREAELLNYIGGEWARSSSGDNAPVYNPATGEEIARVPLSAANEVDEAVRAAASAFPGWRDTPVVDRIQHLFRFKSLLDGNLDALARTIVEECGKTY